MRQFGVASIEQFQSLLRSKVVLRWVVAVYLFSIGALLASAVANPRALQLLCSGAGVSTWVAVDGEEAGTAKPSGSPCVLCPGFAAPPSSAPATCAPVASCPARASKPTDVSLAHQAAPPPPARAPPLSQGLLTL